MRCGRILVAAVAATLALPTAVAAAASPVQTFVTFDPAAGEFPEGVAFDKTGNLYVSLLPASQIRRITPDGTQSVVADFGTAGGAGPAGLAVAPNGTIYAAEPAIDLQTAQTNPDKRGVYRVGRDGTPVRLPGTGAIVFPNDLRLDKHGTVYVTDSAGGSVWRIPKGGSAQLWADGPLLAGTGAAGAGFPIGANGIAVLREEVIVANTDLGALVRIPIRRDGSAGTPSVLVSSPLLVGVDGLALDVHGGIYAVVGTQNLVLRIDRDGSITTLATAAEGLNQPSTAAFGTGRAGNKTLYIANFSLFSPAPTPGVLTLEVGVPGRPLP
ncbi:SMP-30/gluconolactonase/LRE family protein [Amycolatopsis deserti]|nr:SMP-30/gluconolactonase/LRE family protein [Amycolatopsis deserti]